MVQAHCVEVPDSLKTRTGEGKGREREWKILPAKCSRDIQNSPVYISTLSVQQVSSGIWRKKLSALFKRCS